MRKVRKIGLFTCVALVTANMVGTGVFTSLGFQLEAVNGVSAVLLLWLVGGLFAAAGALCYAELASLLPRSGGEYQFLREIYHPALGWMAGVISFVAGFAAPVALAALAFQEYMGAFFPRLRGESFPWLALSLVFLVTAVHSVDLRTSSVFQNIFSVLKLLLVLGFIALGFYFGNAANLEWEPPAELVGDVFSAPFAVSLMFALYAYSGWNAVTYISGEVRNPQRTIGVALMLATGLVTFLYVCLNLSFLLISHPDILRGKLDIARIVAQELFGELGGSVVSVLIGLGLVSSISAMTWAGPRVSQVMGEDFRAIRYLAKVNAGGIPQRALLCQSALVVLIILIAPFRSILLFTQFALIVSSLLTVCGVIVLRVRQPDVERPFRCWGYPVTPLLFISICIFTMGYTLLHQATEALVSVAFLGVTLLCYPLINGLKQK
ncbi:MAG: APC family permease [Chthoniobacterales bacterium]